MLAPVLASLAPVFVFVLMQACECGVFWEGGREQKAAVMWMEPESLEGRTLLLEAQAEEGYESWGSDQHLLLIAVLFCR